MSSIELFRALFDVSKDLSDTSLNGDKKTGKRFVLKKRFAADDSMVLHLRVSDPRRPGNLFRTLRV